jgi:signal transduction histidine kinase/CheY-like chemotaxis protein
LSEKSAAAAATGVFSPVTQAQIEKANLRRIGGISMGTLAFEIINLFNPNFWSTPILWVGAIYLSVVSAAYLLVILSARRSGSDFARPELLNASFWVLFSIGFFPFLVRDAGMGDSPLNCVLLCTVLICAPLLRVKNLRIIFSASVAVNLLAAWYAQGAEISAQYTVELIAINAVGYFMAHNLHGRYFSLLDEQQRMYDQQLADKLAQEALQSKLEQDRMVNAARSEFLSRMSHDLRTPLNAVIGLSDIAMDETLSRDEIQTYLGDINSSAKHLLALINDVLDMSKLESGKMTLHPEPYGMDEFFGTVRSVIGVQCAQADISFGMERDDGFPEYIVVDKLRFNQIFLNLLSNAMKFTPPGGEISLRMSHTVPEPGRAAVKAVVRDTGRGMEPGFAAHAFDAFSQETAEDGEHGAGLGLTIVKSIVELMSGAISIDSQPDKGTSVTVELTADTAERPAAGESGLPAEQGVLRGRRVLLCEDHPLNQKVAECLLEKAGMAVEIAENGSVGVDMFSRSSPGYYDAVLMDVRMPVMDGIAATAAIRALPRADAASVPVIAMTANAYEEDAEATRAAGMNAHLSKPVDPDALYGTLAEYLGKAE